MDKKPKVERRTNPETGQKEWRLEGDTLWTVGEYQP